MFEIRDKGFTDYTQTWDEMKSFTEARNIETPDELWLLEHNSVFTQGLSGKPEHLLKESEILVVQSDRGGQITYHGPGQMICYFVIDLKKRKKDIRKFITLIEETIIDSLSKFNIKTFGDPKNIGIWTNHKGKINKVAAIGVRVSKWIAYHGFAININNDLSKYKNIIPCGISDKGVINLKEIKDQDYKDLDKIIIDTFSKNLEI